MNTTGNDTERGWDYDYRNFSLGDIDVKGSLILIGIFLLVGILA